MAKEQPDTTIDQSKLEREARKRVKALRDFYVHLATFVVINAFLIIINLMTSPGDFWAIWPLLGWGVGLVSHGLSVLELGIGSKEWEERKVREYILQRQSGLSRAEVERIMRDELRASQKALPTSSEWERVLRRLEHLEAIVTSEDWDRVRVPEVEHPSPKLQIDAEPEYLEEEAARIARRVR